MDHKKPFKVLHTLPIIKGMTGIAKTMGNMFQLLQVQTEVKDNSHQQSTDHRATARRQAGAC